MRILVAGLEQDGADPAPPDIVPCRLPRSTSWKRPSSVRLTSACFFPTIMSVRQTVLAGSRPMVVVEMPSAKHRPLASSTSLGSDVVDTGLAFAITESLPAIIVQFPGGLRLWTPTGFRRKSSTTM